MQQKHFDQLQPFCLACQHPETGQTAPLQVATVVQRRGDQIVEGVLQCSNSACLAEYPVIDGIPFLLRNLKTYLARNATTLLQRHDLSPVTESLLGDCCGADAAFNVIRQQTSSYVWGHYADLLPARPDRSASRPNVAAVVAVQQTVEQLAVFPSAGPILDVGCAAGRTSFELAANSDQMILGIDVNPAMLKLAAGVLHTGDLKFQLRRNGLVYESISAALDIDQRDRVDFWACDATDLPFATAQFGRIQCLNTLDSVNSPATLLVSLGRCLATDGLLSMACPYDWSSGVTAEEQWIGGHSQRAEHGGDPVDVLRRLLTQVPEYRDVFEVVNEQDNIPWEVRLHDRSTMLYRLHALVLKRR